MGLRLINSFCTGKSSDTNEEEGLSLLGVVGENWVVLKNGVEESFGWEVETFFFFRKTLMDFINKIQLHPIVKSNQYEMGHLPSILENLVCIMHF